MAQLGVVSSTEVVDSIVCMLQHCTWCSLPNIVLLFTPSVTCTLFPYKCSNIFFHLFSPPDTLGKWFVLRCTDLPIALHHSHTHLATVSLSAVYNQCLPCTVCILFIADVMDYSIRALYTLYLRLLYVETVML